DSPTERPPRTLILSDIDTGPVITVWLWVRSSTSPFTNDEKVSIAVVGCLAVMNGDRLARRLRNASRRYSAAPLASLRPAGSHRYVGNCELHRAGSIGRKRAWG